ncbi:MAG TPA: PaaI family thioesterase [Pyrinomonadaceae bacterium]|nr:PaaI family thioesterase [Pyrinomonadaceae bacterium]
MTLDDVPFAKLLGIEVDTLEPGHAVLSMKMRDDLMRNGGIAHGGAVATLIDSAMAFAIVQSLGEDEHTVTVDLTIHYLRPLSHGTARASARVVRAGKRVITVAAELFDHNDKLAATAISTYLRLI